MSPTIARCIAENRLAEQIFADSYGFYRPQGGFFLWLRVGDGEKAAAHLWRHAGLRVLPGAYLTQDTAAGNIGAYIRVALVAGLEDCERLRSLKQAMRAVLLMRRRHEDGFILPRSSGRRQKSDRLPLAAHQCGAVAAAGRLCALAVLGFDPRDASLSTSSGAPPANWLGRPGHFGRYGVAVDGAGHWLVLLPLAARATRQMLGTHLNIPIGAFFSPAFNGLGLGVGRP